MELTLSVPSLKPSSTLDMKTFIGIIAIAATFLFSSCVSTPSEQEPAGQQTSHQQVYHAQAESQQYAPQPAQFAFLVSQQFPEPSPAPETTLTPEEVGAGGLWDWIKLHWANFAAILLGIYELVVRYFPTVRSYSLLSWIVRILLYIVPDRAKDGRQYVGEKKIE